MGKGLYDPEIFSDVTFDTLPRYNNRHASLLKSDFTAASYAVMTPKGELIKIMKQVDWEAPNLKPNAFRPNNIAQSRCTNLHPYYDQNWSSSPHKTGISVKIIQLIQFTHQLVKMASQLCKRKPKPTEAQIASARSVFGGTNNTCIATRSTTAR